MKTLILFLCVTFSLTAYASGSKMVKVDLDDRGTQIVKAELDLDDTYYYIDTTACVCWLAKIIGGSSAVSVFDCKNLAAYPKLEQYLSNCNISSKPAAAAPVAEATKIEEPKKDKKDK